MPQPDQNERSTVRTFLRPWISPLSPAWSEQLPKLAPAPAPAPAAPTPAQPLPVAERKLPAAPSPPRAEPAPTPAPVVAPVVTKPTPAERPSVLSHSPAPAVSMPPKPQVSNINLPTPGGDQKLNQKRKSVPVNSPELVGDAEPDEPDEPRVARAWRVSPDRR
jgi:hypothetical protein